MATRPDKPKVVDEVWDDERVRSFLHADPADPCVDFYVLLKAYQGMRDHDFQRFIEFFIETGRDLDARNEQGHSLVNVITPHRHARPFIEIMLAAGASHAPAAEEAGTSDDNAHEEATPPQAVVQIKS